MKLHCILFITEATFLDLQDGVSSWVGWIRIQVRSRQKLFDEKWSKELQENNDFLFDHLSDFNLSVSLSLSLSLSLSEAKQSSPQFSLLDRKSKSPQVVVDVGKATTRAEARFVSLVFALD